MALGAHFLSLCFAGIINVAMITGWVVRLTHSSIILMACSLALYLLEVVIIAMNVMFFIVASFLQSVVSLSFF